MHQCDPKTKECRFLFEGAESVGFVLLGLGDTHKLYTLAG